MAPDDPVSVWIEELRRADQDSARLVWNHFAGRLLALAGQRLSARSKRVYDEEDAVQSVFQSICSGFAQGRFPDLKDREGLWRLMLVITSQKIANRYRFDAQQRRDIRRTATDSIFSSTSEDSRVELGTMVASREPTPEFAAEFVDTCDAFFRGLNDPLLEQVAALRMEGFTDNEIAARMDCSRRTIQRRLEMIRRHVLLMESEDE